MQKERSPNLDDLGQDLLGRVLDKLPVQSRAQLESVCKTWHDVSIQAPWSYISHRFNYREQFQPFLAWLSLHISRGRPETVQIIQLRGLGNGEGFPT